MSSPDSHDEKYGVPSLEELGFDCDNLKNNEWIGGETEALSRYNLSHNELETHCRIAGPREISTRPPHLAMIFFCLVGLLIVGLSLFPKSVGSYTTIHSEHLLYLILSKIDKIIKIKN